MGDMTVLDEARMAGSLGGDRYITPEYLAPLPQKDGHTDKSPLQMLAQTCSQIGADSGPKIPDKQKSISGPETKSSKHAPKSSSPTIIVSDGSNKPVSFKPYEITKENGSIGSTGGKIESRKSSLTSSDGGKVPHTSSSPVSGGRSPGLRDDRRETSPRNSSSSEPTPTLSTGMEILAGHPKDLPLGTYRPPVPGSMDHLNPAFRLPGLGLPGYPPTTSSVAGSVCRDPYCKDPNCPTAVYNAYMARIAAARGLPPGYLELMEAHKMAALGGLGGIPTTPPTSLAASSATLGPGAPYICNWMNGRDYCGKRFTSAEELLVHLKTHTNLSASDSGLLGGPGASAAYAGLLGASAASLMGRGATGGPVLPSSLGLGASRYSPYTRAPTPGGLPPSMSGIPGFPPSLAGIPPSFASLAGYPASLYALYGARL